MEPLCRELTDLEISKDKIIWLGVSARHIKEFKATVHASAILPDYLKYLIINTNLSISDVIACVCMYYMGLLDE